MAASKGIAIDERPETYTVKSAENANESLRGRGQRVAKPKGPKSSVSQVLNRGNDVLFLANVEVLDANEELVSQTRTNTKGRWLMALSPGDYQVHVTKRFPPDSGKKSIDTMYQISVPSTDVPLELEPYAVE
jgi:predicted phage tail protein